MLFYIFTLFCLYKLVQNVIIISYIGSHSLLKFTHSQTKYFLFLHKPHTKIHQHIQKLTLKQLYILQTHLNTFFLDTCILCTNFSFIYKLTHINTPRYIKTEKYTSKNISCSLNTYSYYHIKQSLQNPCLNNGSFCFCAAFYRNFFILQITVNQRYYNCELLFKNLLYIKRHVNERHNLSKFSLLANIDNG